MLAKLKERVAAGVTNAEFISMRIFHYSSRLRENRLEGYVIETVRVRGGLYRYVLRSEPVTPFQPRQKETAESQPPLFAEVGR